MTVVRGTKQDFAIRSEPPGADVRLSTGQICKTPCRLKLKRSNGFTATVSKPGYGPQQFAVTSDLGAGNVAGLIAGNVLLGGVIGAVVDSSNGSARSLKPGMIATQLVRSTADPAPVETGGIMASPAGDAATTAAPIAAATTANSGVARRKAPTISGECLDVGPDYVADGSLERPHPEAARPTCASISTFLPPFKP